MLYSQQFGQPGVKRLLAAASRVRRFGVVPNPFEGVQGMHAHDDDLAMYIQGRLPAEKLIPLESHLGSCKICESKLARMAESFGALGRSTQQKVTEERRRDARVETNDQAFMQILSPLSFGRVQIRVMDVSKNGLKLLVPEFLQQGTMVQIRMRQAIMLAEVRHCRKAEAGFHAGVQLQDVFSTSHDVFS